MHLSAEKKKVIWPFSDLQWAPLMASHFDEGWTLEHTVDRMDLEAYFQLRSQCYYEDLGIPHAKTGPDCFDAIGDVFILKKEGKVIGGARAILSQPDYPYLLPLELEGFCLPAALPAFHLQKKRYGEISRLAILPQHRSLLATECLIRFMLAFLEAAGADYLFTNAPLVQARSYRKVFGKMGYHYKILQGIDMPTQSIYSSLEHVVLSAMPFNQAVRIVENPVSSEFTYTIIEPTVVEAA